MKKTRFTRDARLLHPTVVWCHRHHRLRICRDGHRCHRHHRVRICRDGHRCHFVRRACTICMHGNNNNEQIKIIFTNEQMKSIFKVFKVSYPLRHVSFLFALWHPAALVKARPLLSLDKLLFSHTTKQKDFISAVSVRLQKWKISWTSCESFTNIFVLVTVKLSLVILVLVKTLVRLGPIT